MKIFLYTLILFVAAACGSNSKQEVENTTTELSGEKIKPTDLDQLMLDIDFQAPNLVRVESLTYLKADGSMMVATAFLDQNKLITKVVEEYAEVSKNIRSRTEYYSNGGVLFATRRQSEKVKDNQAYFSDEVSFYDENGKVTSSKERVADFEEDIENATYYKIKNVEHSNELALQVLGQKGQFATTFQGFVEQSGYQFLIVGEDVAGDGFTSSLSIQEDDKTILYLKREGKKALGKELKVDFEKITDQQGYKIQILKSVALVERI